MPFAGWTQSDRIALHIGLRRRSAELGAAWSRRISIVILLQGMTAGEFQARPGIPVFLKKRDLIDLNGIEEYLAQLRKRVQQ